VKLNPITYQTVDPHYDYREIALDPATREHSAKFRATTPSSRPLLGNMPDSTTPTPASSARPWRRREVRVAPLQPPPIDGRAADEALEGTPPSLCFRGERSCAYKPAGVLVHEALSRIVTPAPSSPAAARFPRTAGTTRSRHAAVDEHSRCFRSSLLIERPSDKPPPLVAGDAHMDPADEPPPHLHVDEVHCRFERSPFARRCPASYDVLTIRTGEVVDIDE